MPYATNNGVRIHYHIDGNDAGPPLVLQHGFAGSLEDWDEVGYVAALGDEYRIILVDARGHGRSDKPHDPDAYRGVNRASDVVAVLDALDIPQAHFFGYSMGGHIGFLLAAHAAERYRSFILGGDGPLEIAPTGPDPLTELTRQGPDALVAAFQMLLGAQASPALLERVRSNNFEALLASRSCVESRDWVRTLGRVTRPCLIYCGDADAEHDVAQAAAARMPHARFVSLPGLDHAGAFVRSEIVLPHVKAFLAEVR